MSANGLKLIALLAMTIDHIGMFLFPGVEWMRVVGRIAFPIFAFMIAEGCRYTRNRRRYLLQILLIGLGMQVVSFFVAKSLYLSVFISFALAVAMIYILDQAKREQRSRDWIAAGLWMLWIVFLCFGVRKFLPGTDYVLDYGIIGVCIPVLCYFVTNAGMKKFVFACSLLALSMYYGGRQWFCLLAIPLIATYNHQRGKGQLKYLFYVYYPVHLAVIYVLDWVI